MFTLWCLTMTHNACSLWYREPGGRLGVIVCVCVCLHPLYYNAPQCLYIEPCDRLGVVMAPLHHPSMCGTLWYREPGDRLGGVMAPLHHPSMCVEGMQTSVISLLSPRTGH